MNAIHTVVPEDEAVSLVNEEEEKVSFSVRLSPTHVFKARLPKPDIDALDLPPLLREKWLERESLRKEKAKKIEK